MSGFQFFDRGSYRCQHTYPDGTRCHTSGADTRVDTDGMRRCSVHARKRERRHRVPGCSLCDQYGTGMGPSHDASDRCESGRREHCSCNTCF